MKFFEVKSVSHLIYIIFFKRNVKYNFNELKLQDKKRYKKYFNLFNQAEN